MYSMVQNWDAAGSGTITICYRMSPNLFCGRDNKEYRPYSASTLSDSTNSEAVQSFQLIGVVAVELTRPPNFTLQLVIMREIYQFVKCNMKT
jgi:hypothetical protein